MGNNFLEEMKNLSPDDIELILADQKEMYSDQEIELLNEELLQKREAEKEKERQDFIDNLPQEIICIKCEGKISPFDEVCKYCGSKINLHKSLNDMQLKSDENDTETKSYISLYITSVLIPLLGLILGVIYIQKGDEDLGKSFIILSIISMIIGVVIIASSF